MRMRLREANAENSPERALRGAESSAVVLYVKVGRTVKTGITALSKVQAADLPATQAPAPRQGRRVGAFLIAPRLVDQWVTSLTVELGRLDLPGSPFRVART